MLCLASFDFVSESRLTLLPLSLLLTGTPTRTRSENEKSTARSSSSIRFSRCRRVSLTPLRTSHAPDLAYTAGRPPRLRSRPASRPSHGPTSGRIPHLSRLRRRDRPLVAQHGPASPRRHHRFVGGTDDEASRRAQLALSVERLGIVVSPSRLPAGRREDLGLAPQQARKASFRILTFLTHADFLRSSSHRKSFFDAMPRLGARNYVPTDQDILRTVRLAHRLFASQR